MSSIHHRSDLAPPMPTTPRSPRSLSRSSLSKSPRANGHSHLPPVKSSVVVIYAEPALQTTLTFSSDLTVKQVIAKSQAEIESHLASSPGLPGVRIDPECTDFFPAADHDVKIGDLPGLKTIVCWPKSTDASHTTTPSPLVDMLRHLQIEHSDKTAFNATASEDLPKNDVSSLLSRLAKLEASDTIQEELRRGNHARLTNLEREQAASQAKLALFEKQQKDLESTIARLQSALTLSMSAVLGDEEAVVKIRFRVLLDRARAHLAKICGFDSWNQFEAETVDNNDIFNTASRHIRRDAMVSQHWKTLGNKPSLLWALITPDVALDYDMSSEGTQGAESSAIGDSIDALPEGAKKDDFVTIFRAIYDAEP